MQRPGFLRSLLALLGVPWLSGEAPDEQSLAPAELIVTGATIHPVDDSNATPEAFAVRDGRFA
ncbi:MAG TPA: hypothetical protein VGI19_19735, partial [Candidatus Cybelea sp.]